MAKIKGRRNLEVSENLVFHLKYVSLDNKKIYSIHITPFNTLFLYQFVNLPQHYQPDQILLNRYWHMATSFCFGLLIFWYFGLCVVPQYKFFHFVEHCWRSLSTTSIIVIPSISFVIGDPLYLTPLTLLISRLPWIKEYRQTWEISLGT